MHNPEFYDENLDRIYRIVSKGFDITDFYLSGDRYIFIIPSGDYIKREFVELARELKKLNYIPFLDHYDDTHKQIIVAKGLERGKENRRRAYILFIVTLATIIVDGYLRSNSAFFYDIIPGYNPWIMTIAFTIAILGIIGIHEMGHKFMLGHYDIEASLPNFIPGVPGIFPTFGAVISQREIPINRDTLFDIGAAGPIAGFIITLIVSIYSAVTAPIISVQTYQELIAKYGKGAPFPVPPLYMWIMHLIRRFPPGGGIIIVTPLIWASVVGFLLTGLNLLPAWQLDGGHIARAVVGEKYHAILTTISILLLFLTGYMAMAILVLILYMLSGGRSVRPLDDVSSVSTARKILFIILLILAFLCLPNPLT